MIKRTTLALAALSALAVGIPATLSPADAYVVKKVVHVHRGPFGHGCRTIRTVKDGFHGRRVIVRRVCR